MPSHRLAAFTLIVPVVGWGILLSPPFESIRPLLGLPEHLPASRFNGHAAEIVPPDRGDAEWFLARVAHYYHVVFAALLYSMIVLGSRLYPGEWRDTRLLGLAGAVMTAVGGLGYAYYSRSPPLHGLFIAGLAVLFASGLLVAVRLRPRDVLDHALRATLTLMLVGGVIGGYLGSSFMDEEAHKGFVEAKIAARFNPDYAEDNELWRAMVAHEHAMVALADVAAFLVALRALHLRWGRSTRLASYMVLVGLVATAVASYAVWPVGGIAHLVITPASLILLIGVTILAFKTTTTGTQPQERLLALGIRVGTLALWASVVVPGAIVASSLRKPTVFINPAFRDPAWDWAELAYNIGHWHILLAAWGIVLLLAALATQEYTRTRRVAILGGWLALAGFTAASVTVNLYMLGNPPEPYQPNPYDNIWLRLLVEPSLAVMAAGVALAYLAVVYEEAQASLRGLAPRAFEKK
ncbi:hypothetical protein [Pyrodictium delaneyi]|uniref:hypothetical protein n=1 Tax=Pyrodictium delaneyi TaxID=1273541 RepID=UPI0015D6B410|nr:hypothetical protein [Pyrodictium delaneyi]